MSDQPSLKAMSIHFGMELEAQGRPSEGKGLVGTKCGRREAFRGRRQVKSVSVPVQHRDAVQVTQRPVLAGLRQVNRCPPNLLRGTRSNLRPERRGHELGTETDAERWRARRKSAPQHLEFLV